MTALVASGCGSNQDQASGPDASRDVAAEGSMREAEAPDALAAPVDASADAADASDAGSPPQGVVSSSPLTAFEAETQLAVAPDGTIAIVWIGNPSATSSAGQLVGYTFWTPGAAAWSTVQTLTHGPTDYATDPTVVADPAGNFYVAWFGLGSDQVPHVWLAKAPSGTTTFGAPTLVSDPAVDARMTIDDKPWLAATNRGTLLVSYNPVALDANGNPIEASIVVARSFDGAGTWTRTSVPGTASASVAYLCPPTAGTRTYLVDAEGGGGADGGGADAGPGDGGDAGAVPAYVGVHVSDDGQTWSGSNVTLTTLDDVGIPSCAAEGDDLWVDYGLSKTPFAGSSNPDYVMRVAHFGGGGTTLLGDVAASADETAPLFLDEQIVRRPSGQLDRVFFAGQSDGDPAGTFRRTASTDLGATWPASTTVHAPELFTMVRHRGPWLGDYVGLRAVGAALYVAYPRNSETGSSHVAFQILP